MVLKKFILEVQNSPNLGIISNALTIFEVEVRVMFKENEVTLNGTESEILRQH